MTPTDARKSQSDGFPQRVIEALAKRASFICSNPGCRAFTISPSLTNNSRHIYTGIASHITAASPGGPRYDATMTTEQRTSIENGIYLCATCSVMIDKNGGIDFSVELLRGWKCEHDQWANSNFNKRAQRDEESEEFSELEKLIPDLLNEMQGDLAEHPLIRDIIALGKSTYAYNWPAPHFGFFEDKAPGVLSKLRLLVDYGLVEEVKADFAYRITPELAKYLSQRKCA
jgi:hypothetical protein